MTAAPRALLSDRPHRRFNALTGEWVFVSPHRTQRPWQGKIEPSPTTVALQYDRHCYLCPGNPRANGTRNPNYASTYVFDNDFPAFLDDDKRAMPGSVDDARNSADGRQAARALLHSELCSGTCRVICYSPRHDRTLAQMSVPEVSSVIDAWTQQSIELGLRWNWVQIFENKGELMGCSNPHPHGQIWASDFLPAHAARELSQQTQWLRAHGSSLLLDYATLECNEGERVIVQGEHWVAVVPWWASWPFETLLLPLRQVNQLVDLTPGERDSLSRVLKQLLIAYDRLFDCSFPYSFGWHSAPLGKKYCDRSAKLWQLHAHFYPPLLRSASVKKFMVGYELLAEPQRDITPESAAHRLREYVCG